MSTSVGLFDVGYGAPEAAAVAKILNGGTGPYSFEHCAALTNLGPADLFGYAYSDQAFAKVLTPHLSQYDKCAILTSVPIEGNYFTRTIERVIIISTVHQADEILIASHRTPAEYAAIAVIQELLSFEFQRTSGLAWKDLFHEHPRGCIFDFAGVKSQKVGKLIRCAICDVCLGKLSNANVDLEAVNFAKRILHRIRRPSLASAFRLCLTAPFLSFAYGGVVVGAAVNLLSSLALSGNGVLSHFQLGIAVGSVIAIVLFPLSVLAWLNVAELRRRLR